MSFEKEVGSRIKEAREKKGLSQGGLVQKFWEYEIKISAGAISQWEQGSSSPEPSKLPILKEIFDVSVDWLLTGYQSNDDAINAKIDQLHDQGYEDFRDMDTVGNAIESRGEMLARANTVGEQRDLLVEIQTFCELAIEGMDTWNEYE